MVSAHSDETSLLQMDDATRKTGELEARLRKLKNMDFPLLPIALLDSTSTEVHANVLAMMNGPLHHHHQQTYPVPPGEVGAAYNKIIKIVRGDTTPEVDFESFFAAASTAVSKYIYVTINAKSNPVPDYFEAMDLWIGHKKELVDLQLHYLGFPLGCPHWIRPMYSYDYGKKRAELLIAG